MNSGDVPPDGGPEREVLGRSPRRSRVAAMDGKHSPSPVGPGWLRLAGWLAFRLGFGWLLGFWLDFGLISCGFWLRLDLA